MPQLTQSTLARRFSRRAAAAWRPRATQMCNAKPIVTFTFDDCPRTAVVDGARALERQGLSGSFYLSGGLAGLPWENGPQYEPGDVARLLAAGHEVGCHTFSHLDCATAPRHQITRDLDANRDMLLALAPDLTLSTFAYPYGSVSLAAKKYAQSRFLACRGVEAGVNAGTADLGLLKAVSLPHDNSSGAWIAPWLQRVTASNGWLILYTHDVSSDPTPFGCTYSTLAETIAAVQAAGITVMTLREATLHVSGQMARAPLEPVPGLLG